VTSNLKQRIWQHREKSISGFASKYKCNKLVYFEVFAEMTDAISREKQIKAGSRKKKEALINSINPGWKDLYDQI
jgi:putative endonuclease